MSEEKQDPLLEAIEFCEGAILDAIACEDGLDGATGYRILTMIWPVLEQHGLTSCITPDCRDKLKGMCGDPSGWRTAKPVSIENRELRAIVAKLPVTKDGVPVVPGMKVYQRETTDAGSTWDVIEHQANEFWLYPGWIRSRTYSTRRAAEAAEVKARAE